MSFLRFEFSHDPLNNFAQKNSVSLNKTHSIQRISCSNMKFYLPSSENNCRVEAPSYTNLETQILKPTSFDFCGYIMETLIQ